jgi:hypothetical protein
VTRITVHAWLISVRYCEQIQSTKGYQEWVLREWETPFNEPMFDEDEAKLVLAAKVEELQQAGNRILEKDIVRSDRMRGNEDRAVLVARSSSGQPVWVRIAAGGNWDEVEKSYKRTFATFSSDERIESFDVYFVMIAGMQFHERIERMQP